MVQVSFDTNADSLEELEHALHLLQQAVARKAKSAPAQEETAVDTPFFKITVKEADERAEQKAEQKVPTLNELLSDERLTEEEMSKMFKEQLAEEHPKPHGQKKDEDAYIEIIEYDEKEK